jgi:hypothetical protein
MKRFIIPAIIGLSALSSLAYTVSASAAINPDKEPERATELTTVETENASQLELSQIDSNTEEVANNICYWEVYPDGSYAWICW